MLGTRLLLPVPSTTEAVAWAPTGQEVGGAQFWKEDVVGSGWQLWPSKEEGLGEGAAAGGRVSLGWPLRAVPLSLFQGVNTGDSAELPVLCFQQTHEAPGAAQSLGLFLLRAWPLVLDLKDLQESQIARRPRFNPALFLTAPPRLACQAMRQLHPEAIAAIQSKALFSKAEEQLLSKVGSVRPRGREGA